MTQESVRPAKSTGELVSELSESVSRLVRDELQLAAVEMREKGK
ncbi:MAG: phage holin family protein, partial [Kibdelosporangium sp.]